MCEKRRFTSPAAARAAAGKMTKRVRTYLCEFCHAWHLSASLRTAKPDRFDHTAKVATKRKGRRDERVRRMGTTQ